MKVSRFENVLIIQMLLLQHSYLNRSTSANMESKYEKSWSLNVLLKGGNPPA